MDIYLPIAGQSVNALFIVILGFLVGVLPITFLYAGVGTELAGLDSPTGLLSLRVLGSLVVLALAPLLVRLGLRWSGYSGVQAAT